MEIGKQVVAAGVVLFCLGGLSVYALMVPADEAATRAQANPAQLQQEASPTTTSSPTSEIVDNAEDVLEMTHAAFIAQAEARREQNLEDKAEAERIEKLLKEKQNSVECKFWKQQQKTSSAAAKIEEKINQFCHLPVSAAKAADHLDNAEDSGLTPSAIQQ
jgi:hypothetical protein